MMNHRRTVLLLVAAIGWSQVERASGDEPSMPEPSAVKNADWTPSARSSQTEEDGAIQNYYQQVGHRFTGEPGEPIEPHHNPDPYGPERLAMPTPITEHGFYGAPHAALNTRPDVPTIGIRLDTSYCLLRSIDAGLFGSEHQHVAAAGATALPIQTPCFVIGTRMMATSVENLSMLSNTVLNNYTPGFALDVFAATRYKGLYTKYGAFWDYQDHFGKVGFEYGLLARAPIVGNLTFDAAFASATGKDVFSTELDPVLGIRPRRVENAEFDMQLRLGRFWTPNFQLGATGNYYAFDHVLDEYGLGAFCRYRCGRATIGADVTGGHEGLRGFVTLAISLGKAPKRHPQDERFCEIDTVAWATEAPMRDLSVRLRSSFTGPLAP